MTIQISTGSGNTSISELALKAVLCGMTQYSIRPKRSAIRAQAVYFLLSTMPSVTYLRLSDVSVSDALLIFSFQFNLLFFHISVARQHHHYGVLLDLIRNIGHWTLPQIWVDTFPVRSVQPSGKTELILTVKMETRHPIDGQFGSEFPAICNHCGVMAAWSRKTWKFCEQFLRSLEKLSLTVKFLKFCSETFHRLTDRRCSNVIKFVRLEIWEILRYLPKQKISTASQVSLLRGSHPISARASPRHLAHSAPDFIQIGSLSA